MTRTRRPPECCFHGVRPEDCHQCSPPRRGPALPEPGTAARAIYDAACRCPSPVTIETLAVMAWRLNGPAMALPGYPQYPDIRRVKGAIYGQRRKGSGGEGTQRGGLLARGLMAKAGRGRFVAVPATEATP